MAGAETYLLKRLTLSATLVTAALVGVLWLGLGLRFADKVIGEGVPLSLFLKFALLALPAPLALALPIGLFVGTLWTYSTLAGDSELIALRAAGLDDARLLRPAGIVGIAALLLGLVLAAEISPRAAAALRAEQLELRASLGRVALAQGGFFEPVPGLTLRAAAIDGQGQIRDFLAHDTRMQGRAVTLVARDAIARPTDDGLELLLRDGLRQERDQASGRIRSLAFESFRLVVRRDVEVARNRLDADALRLEPLLTRLAGAGGDGDAARLRAELARRLATPLLSPALALLAATLFVRRGRLPFGRRRAVALVAFGACLLAAASLGLAQLAADAAIFGWLAISLPILAVILCAILAGPRGPARVAGQ